MKDRDFKTNHVEYMLVIVMAPWLSSGCVCWRRTWLNRRAMSTPAAKYKKKQQQRNGMLLALHFPSTKSQYHNFQLKGFIDMKTLEVEHSRWSGSKDGAVVRALASHKCGPGSIPRSGVIRGLSLLVLYSAPRGFSPGTPGFPSPQKPYALIWFDFIYARPHKLFSLKHHRVKIKIFYYFYYYFKLILEKQKQRNIFSRKQ